MFKFGFDLPADDDGDANEAEVAISANKKDTVDVASTKNSNATSSSSKPATSVLNISDAISSVFESDTLFEYVPLVRGGSGGEKSEEESNTSIKPLRRIVFPPDQKLPPSLGAAAASEVIDKESLADTDLIPGVYEGGLKVWECSLDLCRHLAHEIFRLQSSAEGDCTSIDGSANNDVRHALSRTGKTLELGCGHGLPACLVFRELRKRWHNKDDAPSGADDGCSVLFSDYNEFVLRDATVPNIVLNMDSERPCPNDEIEWKTVQGCVGCVSGDWMDLSNRLQAGSLDDTGSATPIHLPLDGRFDLILAAETTYTEESAMDTAKLLGRHLKVETGVGLVATKRYYFGVGGGADAFRQAAANITVQTTSEEGDKGDCRLLIETVKSYDSGVGRDLLRVRLVPID